MSDTPYTDALDALRPGAAVGEALLARAVSRPMPAFVARGSQLEEARGTVFVADAPDGPPVAALGETAELLAALVERAMPDLEGGSAKQIAWARDIRRRTIAYVVAGMMARGAHRTHAATIDAMMTAIACHTDARGWIDRRSPEDAATAIWTDAFGAAEGAACC